ncbi:hypothetical protein N8083_02360 [Candidatus Pacebacteria bacterium]|nr:hypothetical protein [Candidatus Paceibacterota bacterium]
MNQKAVVMTIILFVLIIVGMFTFAYLKKTEQQPISPDVSNKQVQEDRYSNITRIEGVHFFIDGVHTVVGEIPMPTPCDLLESKALIAESYPEQITLDFSVINNAEFCVQQITSARFKIVASASEEATFKAIFQNRVVELNLIEAPDGEVPEDFELFIKG